MSPLRSPEFGSKPPIPVERQVVDPLGTLETHGRYTVTVRRVGNKPDWEFTFTGVLTSSPGRTKLEFRADHGVKVEVGRSTIVTIADPEEEAA